MHISTGPQAPTVPSKTRASKGWMSYRMKESTVKFIFPKYNSHAILKGKDCTRKWRVRINTVSLVSAGNMPSAISAGALWPEVWTHWRKAFRLTRWMVPSLLQYWCINDSQNGFSCQELYDWHPHPACSPASLFPKSLSLHGLTQDWRSRG